MNQIHFVSVFIDTESKRVYSCDSLPHASKYQTDTIILMRKWIAKSKTLINYCIKNNETGFDLLFGSDNMTAGVEFNDEVGKNSRMMVEHILCIYTIWYLLIECYKGKEVVDLNTEKFCEQLLFYIVCLHNYCHCIEKESYNFLKTFEWSDLMKKAFKKGSDIHETIKDISESQQDFQVMLLKSLSFQQWCVGSHKLYSKVNNYFYNASLSLMVSNNFSGALANFLNADVRVQVE